MFPKERSSNHSGPVAIITASTAGIGLAIAHSLASEGYHVVISSRKQHNVTVALSSLHSRHGPASASGMPCHVSQQSDRERLLEYAKSQSKDGKIDTLVLNAAASTSFGPVLQTTESQWDKMFDVNIKSSFLLIKQFAPYLTNSVIFISSIAAYNALPGVGAYSVTKTALLGFTKVLANELGPKGIRVNCVSPGIIKTKFSEGLWKDKNSLGQKAVQGKAEGPTKLFYVPLKRLGEPDDIGSVVAFLVSDKASYITGESIVVAGGALSKL